MTEAVKKETKKAARARIIAEKLAAKEARKAALFKETFEHPVAIAVQPLRVAAMEQAEEKAKAQIDRIEKALEKADFNLDTVAPEYSWRDVQKTMSYEVYKGTQAKRAEISRVTKRLNPNRMWNDQSPVMVEMDADAIVQYISMAKDIAAQEYEAFVYKLVRKLKEHAPALIEAATLNPEAVEDDSLWSLSILTVTRAGGGVERWKTRMIWNVSVLGKVFPQWPTRLLKESDAVPAA